MANILDYLDWRGDLQISERGFNEVDNLLLAELCYLDFGGIVPPGFDAPVPLQEAMRRYDVLREHESMGVLVPGPDPGAWPPHGGERPLLRAAALRL